MSLWDEVGAFVDAREADLVARVVSAESQLSTVLAELDAAHADVTGASRRIDELEDEVAVLVARIAELEKPVDPAGWVTFYDSTFAKDDGWEKRSETQSNDNSYNTARNVVFGDGLTIIGRREVAGGRPYTTGDVLGRHVRVPNYFRAEVTATLPTDYGMWPCPLWFRPLTHGDSGEIDVCETWPFDWALGAKAHATVWENYTSKRKENASLLYSKLPNPDPAAPHTYTVEKVKGRITFWIDGVLLYSWEKPTMNTRIASWYDSVYEVPGREWYPRITLQAGGPNAREPKPEWQESRMVIHRLRIYKEA